jgi:hypothetical protein
MSRLPSLVLAVLAATAAHAGPYIEAGDLALRHDIQLLAEAGVISGTTSTWPLAWAPILADIEATGDAKLLPGTRDALERVRRRAGRANPGDGVRFGATAGVASKPTRIRSFEDTPRGDVDASAGVSWTSGIFVAEVTAAYVDSGQDADELRFDGSLVGLTAGNWSIAASTQERWWGPSWDGSLILSNNARPFPSLVIDRVMTDAFESKWLSWIGPWDLNVMFGQLETERAVPDAQFFGMRFSFRPLRSLEIGLSRSAQWCGDGRPCDAGTFLDLLLGHDNRGDDDIEVDNEPGNQLAGVDLRWVPGFLGGRFGVYGQFIGEDEAGGFPSRWMGQFGADWTAYLAGRWSARFFAEFSGTTCQFYEESERFNCAYNHSIYRTGYRYRARSIGHGADNDARLVTLGGLIVDRNDTRWNAFLRYGRLNRGGGPDPNNTLTPTPQSLASIDVAHSRVLGFGTLEVGAGYEWIDDDASGEDTGDARLYLQWHSDF